MPINPNTPKLKIENTGPINVIDILKAFEPKKSFDLDGLSMELLKFVAWRSVGLSLIFLTVALTLEGSLPPLKGAERYLFTKGVMPSCVTTTDLFHYKILLQKF